MRKTTTAIIIAIFLLSSLAIFGFGCKKSQAGLTSETIKEDDNSKVSATDSSILETTTQPETEKNTSETSNSKYEANPDAGEYFVNALLKEILLSASSSSRTIIVEQLINDPDEKNINPEVKLANDCEFINIILERPSEKETITEINLEDIPIGSEIGIIFNSENYAKTIISQEIVEN
ncbi:MAG: hypothetical protein ACYCXK_03260 [Candidatus Humimicrobiaceae bacterium]